jgi:hypothetical protein
VSRAATERVIAGYEPRETCPCLRAPSAVVHLRLGQLMRAWTLHCFAGQVRAPVEPADRSVLRRRQLAGHHVGEHETAGRVDGRVAVVTGAARGIGRACALRLVEEGAYQFGPSGIGHLRACYARDEVQWSAALDRVVASLIEIGKHADGRVTGLARS